MHEWTQCICNLFLKTQESNVDSSESDVDEVPTKDKKKLLKRSVLKYLTEKVSPRSVSSCVMFSYQL